MPDEVPPSTDHTTIHVAWASTGALLARFPEGGPYDLAGPLACLDTRERERLERFRFAADACSYAAAHALLRLELERHGGTAAAAWRFEVQPGGRPELAPVSDRALRFSLSHSRGAVACATALGSAPVGVDVERVHERSVVDEVAPRVLSLRERSSLEGLADGDACRRFFARWTLKEAYAKALGVGLSMPFDRIEWRVAANLEAELLVAPDAAGAPLLERRDWSHAVQTLGCLGADREEHLVAACLHARGARLDARIQVVERELD